MNWNWFQWPAMRTYICPTYTVLCNNKIPFSEWFECKGKGVQFSTMRKRAATALSQAEGYKISDERRVVWCKQSIELPIYAKLHHRSASHFYGTFYWSAKRTSNCRRPAVHQAHQARYHGNASVSDELCPNSKYSEISLSWIFKGPSAYRDIQGPWKRTGRSV